MKKPQKKKRFVPWADHVLRGRHARTTAATMRPSNAQMRRETFLKNERLNQTPTATQRGRRSHSRHQQTRNSK